MRRRSSSHSPISLFTFLDTLVCTMGSLILMLLAMTPKIRERAEARELAGLAALAPAVEPAPPPPVAAVSPSPSRSSPDERADRAASRDRRRAEWLRALDEARQKLLARQTEYQRRRQLLKDSTTRLKELEDQSAKSRTKEAAAADADQSLTELETKLEEQQAKIAQKIALTRKNIDLLNRQQSDHSNEYALVPYEGSSGSVRRPIYLECSGKGFRFLPEDETVSPVDLKEFPENYNPLLTGTQVLLHYWARHRRESGGTEPEPYVLLIVRPSGCLNYYVARGFLASLGTNFGYELIEEDWKIRVPDPDPVAKSLLKETLDLTVQTQSEHRGALADAAQRNGFGRGRGTTRGGWTEDPPLFDDDGGLGGPLSGPGRHGNGKPSIKFGPATRRAGDLGGGAGSGDGSQIATAAPGRARGNGIGTGSGTDTGIGGEGKGGPDSPDASGDRSGTTSPQRTAGSTGRKVAGGPAGIDGGARSATSGRRAESGGAGSGDGSGVGTGDGSVFTSRRPGAGAADGIPGATGGGGGGESGAGGTPGMESLDGDAGANDAPRTGRGLAGTRAGPRGRSGSRPATIGGAPAEGDGGDGGDGNGDGEMPLELPLDYVPRRLRGPGGGGGSGADDEPLLLREIPEDASGNSGVGSSGSAAGGPTGGRQSVPGATSANAGSAGSGPPSSGKKGSDSGNLPSTSVSDLMGPGSDGGDASSGGPSGPVQFGGPGASISLGSQKKRKTSDDESDGPRVQQDDANSRGKRGRATGPRLWGQARAKATIGLERKLQIRIYDDRILIGSKDVAVPVGNGETIKEMINQVVMGIDHAVNKWGEPPVSFYWAPSIRFVVYPGGNQYYERLREPLEHDWGLATTMELAPDPAGGKPQGKATTKPSGKPSGGSQ